MELLIPGLILVALMVYVSTRIKRAAAGAYEEERIETETFSITKPDGFIVMEDDDPSVLFGAYSKEYGTEAADEFRQVSAELKIHPGISIEEVRDRIQNEKLKIIEEQHLAGPTLLIDAETKLGAVPAENKYRLAQNGNDTFEFRVTALSETKAANERAITTLLSSFELK